MRCTRWSGVLAACLFATPVAAELIVYTHEGSGSGTLGGEPFSDTGFVITAVVDTDDTVPLPPYLTYVVHLNAEITIDGVGTLEFTEPTTHLVDHLFGGVAFGILLEFGGGTQEPGAVMSGPIEPGMAVWDMTTSVGPNTGPGLHEAWMARPVDTPEGELIFDEGEFTATFSAEVMAPAIATDPAAVSQVMAPGEVADLSLTIGNSGMAPLDWEVTEDLTASNGVLRPFVAASEPRVKPASGAIEGLAYAAGAGSAEVAYSFPEARGEAVVLSHSESLDILSGNTQVCSPDGGFTTRPNQFLRVFELEDFHITGDFDVTEVTFGVEILRDTSAEIDVNLYTLDGDFVYANMDQIGSASEELEPQEMTMVTVPVSGTAPAGSTLVVEIASPELSEVGAFFPGSNGDGESARSYLAASDCGFPEPRPYSIISETPVHLVLTVAGTGPVDLPDCDLPEWAEIDPTSGTVAAGEEQVVDLVLEAGTLEPGTYSASLCLESNDPEVSLLPVPLDLTVSGDPDGSAPVHVPTLDTAGLLTLILLILGLGGLVAARGTRL